MKKHYFVGIVLALTILIIGAFFWMSYLDVQSALKHEGDRWAAIADREGSLVAVEPLKVEVWEQLVELFQSKDRKWVGGIVERYANKWGFRFAPKNVTVADFTAEGLQATVRYISENLDYWLGGWAYVSAKVTEIHSP